MQDNLFTPALWAKDIYNVTGEASYCAYEINNAIKFILFGEVKQKEYRLYDRYVCNEWYKLDIAYTQFCGLSKSKTTFSEVRN